jgi:hypothetical protein
MGLERLIPGSFNKGFATARHRRTAIAPQAAHEPESTTLGDVKALGGRRKSESGRQPTLALICSPQLLQK